MQEELGKERPGKASVGRKGSKWTRMRRVRYEEKREEPRISNTDSCLPGRALGCSSIISFTWHSSMSKSRLVLTNHTDPILVTWFRARPVSPALVTRSLRAFLGKVAFFLNGDSIEGITLFSFWVLACLNILCEVTETMALPLTEERSRKTESEFLKR